MSKTKGNVLDPTEITAEYGADALRFALVTQGSPGIDMRLSMQLVEASRNFVNKLWNATRFALTSIQDIEIEMAVDGPASPSANLSLADQWIISRTHAITAEVTSLLGNHLYGEAGRQLREFVWSELCDWYIEAAKVRLRGSDDERKAVAQTLAFVLERSVRLLHPFMPFATEALWQQLPHVGESVMIASWPEAGDQNPKAEETLVIVQELVSKIRNARADMSVEPAKLIAATIHAGERSAAMESLSGELAFLGRISGDELTITNAVATPTETDVVIVASDVVGVLPLTGLVDLAVERGRVEKELAQVTQERERLERQLGNSAFVERAPTNVVEGQRNRLAIVRDQIGVLEQRLTQLGN